MSAINIILFSYFLLYSTLLTCMGSESTFRFLNMVSSLPAQGGTHVHENHINSELQSDVSSDRLMNAEVEEENRIGENSDNEQSAQENIARCIQSADQREESAEKYCIAHSKVIFAHEVANLRVSLTFETGLVKMAPVRMANMSESMSVHDAASKGDITRLEKLFSDRPEALNEIDMLEQTPLHCAILANQKEVVSYLVGKKAHIMAQNAECLTPLHLAASTGNCELINLLLESGAEIEARDIKGQTPLHVSVLNGHERALDFLIKSGADVRAIDYNGNNIFHFASAQGHVNIVEELEPNLHEFIIKANKFGSTPLHFAAFNGQFKMMRVLIKKGAGIDCYDINGRTPFILAILNNKLEFIRDCFEAGIYELATYGRLAFYIFLRNQHDDGIRSLLSCGYQPRNLSAFNADLLSSCSNPNFSDRDGATPLGIAACYGKIALMEKLIGKGAIIDHIGLDANTPLHEATWNNQVDALEYLIKNGANVLKQNRKGLLPLHLAAQKGHIESVKLLTKFISMEKLNTQDNEGSTPLHLAASQGHISIVAHLIEAGADTEVRDKCGWTPFIGAAFNANLSVLRQLRERNVNVGVLTNNRSTALHFAAMRNKKDVKSWENTAHVFEWLVRNCAPIDGQNLNGRTALHEAADTDSTKTGILLIEKLLHLWADINTQDKQGNTPLHIAVYRGNNAVAEYLMINSDLEIRNNKFLTPFLLAVTKGNIPLIKSFLKRGINIEVRNQNGQTALHLAVEAQNLEMVDILLEAKAIPYNVDYKGQSAVHLAATLGNTAILSAIVKSACESKRQLLMHFASLTRLPDNRGFTPLHAAAQANQIQVFACLLNMENTYPENLEIYESIGPTLCLKPSTFMLELTEVRDNDGCTPLHIAAQNGHIAAINSLKSMNADVFAKNNEGKTPRHLAEMHGHPEAVRCLSITNGFLHCPSSLNIAQEGAVQPIHTSSLIANSTGLAAAATETSSLEKIASDQSNNSDSAQSNNSEVDSLDETVQSNKTQEECILANVPSCLTEKLISPTKKRPCSQNRRPPTRIGKKLFQSEPSTAATTVDSQEVTTSEQSNTEVIEDSLKKNS